MKTSPPCGGFFFWVLLLLCCVIVIESIYMGPAGVLRDSRSWATDSQVKERPHDFDFVHVIFFPPPGSLCVLCLRTIYVCSVCVCVFCVRTIVDCRPPSAHAVSFGCCIFWLYNRNDSAQYQPQWRPLYLTVRNNGGPNSKTLFLFFFFLFVEIYIYKIRVRTRCWWLRRTQQWSCL